MEQEKTQSTKTCKDCGRELPLTQFTKTRNGNYGTLCKECKGKRIKAAMKAKDIPAHQAEVETVADTSATIQDALAAAAGNIARRKKNNLICKRCGDYRRAEVSGILRQPAAD